MENLINELYARLEAHMVDTHDSYIGNPNEIRDAIARLVSIVQPGDSVNRCVECKIDIGQMNPRQYCAKTHCANAPFSEY
jgi:hypothetical protein